MRRDWVQQTVRELRSRKNYLKGVMLSQSEEKRSGDAADYWSSSQKDETIQDRSHWRGAGRFASDAVWLGIGRENLERYESLRALMNRGPIRSMVEWGPGGGSNAVAFAPMLETFYGVDISQPNLEECGRQLSSLGFQGYKPVLVDPKDTNAVRKTCLAAIEPVDFFLSVAVFQHFPSKAFGLEVLSIAKQLLKPDGIAVIQIRYDDGSIRMRAKTSSYHEYAMFFTSYKLDEFWNDAERAGFRPLALKLEPQSCYAFYLLANGPAAAP